MKEILDEANELGLMLRSTEAFMEFNGIKEIIERDETASEILAQYNAAAEEIQLKQQNGIEIESYEQEKFRDLTQKVIANYLLKDYLIKKNNYMELLMLIHETMSLGQGE